jgi:predicted enzyme related to lactoylglutathione lyase
MTMLLINIDVPDLERAIAFYTRAFELQLGRRLGSGTAELLGANAAVFLLQNDAGSAPFASAGTDVRRDYARHWTPVHLDFVVPDLDAALARAVAAGAQLEGAPADHAYGRLAVLSDPFGHGVCLVQLSARGYDAVATG